MKLGQTMRTLQILGRIAQGPREAGPDPRLVEERDLVAPRTRMRFDRFAPRGRADGVLIALHGVTVQGGRDARLAHFARCLARSGVACAVPSLSGLGECRLHAGDLDELEELVELLAAEASQPVGMVGFSYGGSYALVTAARVGVAARVRFVLAFGAYASLDEVFDQYVETRQVEPTTEADWDNRIYLHLVLAEQHGEALGLPVELRARVRLLLERYCCEASADEKRRFFEERLRGLDLVLRCARRHDRSTLEALSPAGKLGGVVCPVSLVHDLHDTMVPPGQSEKLHAELQRLPRPERFQLLVTPLLSHVDLSALYRLGDLRRLVSALSVLLGED